ncbi:MAG: hypothetical protein GY862_14540 [Gammaproteobacteria bacterium]|nr:hypothetical protein [Gammaproteobacteria bacterium]
MSNLTLQSKADLSGGTVSGYINSSMSAVIRDVHVARGAYLRNGRLEGTITGDGAAFLEGLAVAARLSGVVIGDLVRLEENAILGEGVRFGNAAYIPEGLELLPVLPVLPAPDCADGLSGSKFVDAAADVLYSGDGLLAAVNQLPLLAESSLRFNRNARYGYLQLDLDSRYAEQIVSVKRATGPAEITLPGRQGVRFVTDTGLEILTQPALQAPCALQTILAELELPELLFLDNGDFRVPVSAEVFFLVPTLLRGNAYGFLMAFQQTELTRFPLPVL